MNRANCVVFSIFGALVITTGVLFGQSESISPKPLSIKLKFTKDYFPGTYDVNGKFMGCSATMRMVAFRGKLYAALGNGMDLPYGKPKGNDPSIGPQILVKEGNKTPWRVEIGFDDTYVRVEAMESLTFETDGAGKVLPEPISVLAACPSYLRSDPNAEGKIHATVWLRDEASGKWISSNVEEESKNDSARSIITHRDAVTGISHVFAGLSSGKVRRGVYDKSSAGHLRWENEAELSGTGRVMSMVEANGSLYAACGINDDTPLSGGLFRRIDGPSARWELVYRWPYRLLPTGDETEIMRSLQAVPNPDGNGQSIIGTRTFQRAVDRIDCLRNHAATRELCYFDYFRKAFGGIWEKGPAFADNNNVFAMNHPSTGEPIHLFGMWVERQPNPTPPNNGSYFLLRRADQSYEWGEVMDTENLVPAGQSLRGNRTIEMSPFPEDKGKVLYFGGYDCNRDKSHNTAWIYRATIE